jgi:hypothetical protein
MRWTVWITVAACLLAIAHVAGAQQAPQAPAAADPEVFYPFPIVKVWADLEFVRERSASVCPGEQWMRDLMGARMGSETFKPNPRGVYVGRVRVIMSRATRGFAAAYTWVEANGVEHHERFVLPGDTWWHCREPQRLTAEDTEAIRALATDLPALWNAPTTTPADRKTILRLLIERVDVTVDRETSGLDLAVRWAGGHETRQHIRRPVHKLDATGDKDAIMAAIHELRRQGLTAKRIADQLNADGWITPTQRSPFNERLVRAMMHRYGRVARGPKPPPRGAENAWWLADLACELRMPLVTLHGWLSRGLVQARRIDGQWAVLADKAELRRLRQLRREHPTPTTKKKSSKRT